VKNPVARLNDFVKANLSKIGKVVDFDPAQDKLYQFDLTAGNKELEAATISDTVKFSFWVSQKLKTNGCRYGIGGFLENRTIYAYSPLFNNASNERTLHLGVDIWAAEGTPVYAPLNGKAHSFQDNNNFGDYGPTIILEHDLDGLQLYTLYGHLSRKSLEGLFNRSEVTCGQQIATFGNAEENGNWPPHLHFQLMFDMQGKLGDYPGVCNPAEKEHYLANIADPQIILQLPRAVNA